MKTIIKWILFCVLICLPISFFCFIDSTMLSIMFVCIYVVMLVTFLSVFEIGDRLISQLQGRIIIYKSKDKKAKNFRMGKNCIINYPETIAFGDNVSLGHNVEIFPLASFHTEQYTPKISIGNNVIIGDYNRFACKDTITIEDNVLFAAYVHITDHSHEYRDPSISIMEQGVFEKGPVKIGKGSWIGLRCSILSGVSIGEHSVIGAGSIVTRDIPSYSIAVGAPAKVIKKYDFQKGTWVDVKEE